MSDDFPKAGDICENCRERWEDKKLPPKQLIALPSVTQIYHSEVAVCSFCDGDPLIEFAYQNAEKREREEEEPENDHSDE